VLESIASSIQQFIHDVGYPGLLVLIILESTLVPVPSELVMPFAGFLASRGEFSLPVVLAVNTIGAAIGSTISYLIGFYAGRPFLERYGKWFLLRRDDIEKTHAFFEKRGRVTVFLARFLPVIRHVISVPAGIARMRYDAFLLLTCLGATIWGGALIVLGYYLGAQWDTFASTLKHIDLLVGALIVLAVIAVVVRFVLRRKGGQAVPSDER
jgi:membrane protein DedA with SNARE-associated domain